MSWEAAGISLLRASLARPLVLAAASWLLLRVFGVRHSASRHAVWTAVLIGTALLPVVSVIAPALKLAVLPSGRAPEAQPARSAVSPAPFEPFTPVSYDGPAAKLSASLARPSRETLILGVYLAGVLAMLAYRSVGWVLLRRVVARSPPVHGRLRESADVLAPVAVGVVRPTVILPAGWRAWSAQTRRAVLAHEFAHLRRRDTTIAALARLVQCVFWFHPLAWWLSRMIANLAELACDAAALDRVPDPAIYSRILLDFTAQVNRAGRRAALPGLTMASSAGMGLRIDQVFELSRGRMRRLSRPAATAALLGAPVLCLAATVTLGERQDVHAPMPSGAAPQAHPQPVPTAAPDTAAPVGAELTSAARPVVAEAPASSPTPVLAAADPPQSGPVQETHRGFSQTRAETDAAPKFAVASIKPCTEMFEPSGGRGPGAPRPVAVDPGRIRINCMPLEDIIMQAYVLYASGQGLSVVPHGEQWVRGGPSWIGSPYEIDAKPEGTQTAAMMRGPMMQALLEDRFKLKIHRETKEMPAYALVVAKSGPKLEATKEGSCTPVDLTPSPRPPLAPGPPPACGSSNAGRDGLLKAQGWSMENLSGFLTRRLNRKVVDKTGITGIFDIIDVFDMRVRFDAPLVNMADESGLADLSPTVQDDLQKLGLRLEPFKDAAELIVIDHIERPSEN